MEHKKGESVMRVFLWCLLGCLVALGLAQLWEGLLLWGLRPKALPIRYSVLPLRGAVEQPEQLLRYVRFEAGEQRLLLVDCGLDEASRVLCQHFCQQRPGLQLLSPREAAELIFGPAALEPRDKT